MKKILAILLLFAGVSFAQNNMVTWETVAIDSGETVSATLDISSKNRKIIGVGVDTTNWTSANLTIDQQFFGASSTIWGSVQDYDNTEFTITLGAISEPVFVYLPPSVMAGLTKIRFISSAAQDVDGITLYVATRPY